MLQTHGLLQCLPRGQTSPLPFHWVNSCTSFSFHPEYYFQVMAARNTPSKLYPHLLLSLMKLFHFTFTSLMNTSTQAYVSVYGHVYMCIYIHIHICVYKECLCIHKYVYAHIHKHTQTTLMDVQSASPSRESHSGWQAKVCSIHQAPTTDLGTQPRRRSPVFKKF